MELRGLRVFASECFGNPNAHELDHITMITIIWQQWGTNVKVGVTHIFSLVSGLSRKAGAITQPKMEASHLSISFLTFAKGLVCSAQ